MNATGLILAAGKSSRMGRDKALLDYRGRTFLNHLTYLALPRVDSVVVVLGHNAGRIRASLPNSPRVRPVVNARYELGMLSSLQRGLAEAASSDWILWMLVDHPAVRGRTLDALLGAAAGSAAPVVIPRFDGERGHPILLSATVAAELAATAPASSPQDVIRSHYPEAEFVDLDDRGVLVDVDDPDEYDRLGRAASARSRGPARS